MSAKKLFVLCLIEMEVGGEGYDICNTLADSVEEAAQKFGGQWRQSARLFAPGPETVARISLVSNVSVSRIGELLEWHIGAFSHDFMCGTTVLKIFERPLLT